MTPQILLVWVGGLFALIVTGVITLFILDIFWNGTTGIFTSNTAAANATRFASQGISSMFEQMPNVGKLAGVSLIIGVMALMGIGGYMAYRRLRS